MEKIRFQDLNRLHESVKPALTSAFEKVLESSAFIQGPFVAGFEAEFASFTGAKHCLGVANGTDAIEIVLEALGIGEGDLVLLPSLTFTATAEAVVRAKAVPVFADVDADTLCAEVKHYQAALSQARNQHPGLKPKALILVHLHGRVLNPEPLMEWAAQENLEVIEDCAQAHGAWVSDQHAGTFGAAGTFSFYPGKNLGALGDAGAIITNSDALAQKVRLLRDHGRTQKYFHEAVGRNSRLDGLQAAFLSVKLKSLPEWTRRRQDIAKRYHELLTSVSGLMLPPLEPQTKSHVFHNFVIKVTAPQKNRDGLKTWLQERGIETGIHYPLGLHEQPAYKDFTMGALASTEKSVKEILSLPIDPFLDDNQIQRVSVEVRNYMGSKG